MSDFKISYKNNKQVLDMFRRDNTILIYIILLAVVLGIFIASAFVF